MSEKPKDREQIRSLIEQKIGKGVLNYLVNVDKWDNYPKPRNKYIQAVVLYEVLDPTIFRTEAGPELNIAETKTGNKIMVLGRKLKAHQRRRSSASFQEIIEQLMDSIKRSIEENNDFRTVLQKVFGYKEQKPDVKQLSGKLTKDILNKVKTCALLKDLCMLCPADWIFGATPPEGFPFRVALHSRVLYSAYYTVEDYEDIREEITLNVVDERSGTTEEFLASHEVVMPLAIVPATITLWTLTDIEFAHIVKLIYETRRFGARTAVHGYLRPHIIGFLCGDFEMFSSMELSDHLFGEKVEHSNVDRLSAYINKTVAFLKNIAKKYGGTFVGIKSAEEQKRETSNVGEGWESKPEDPVKAWEQNLADFVKELNDSDVFREWCEKEFVKYITFLKELRE